MGFEPETLAVLKQSVARRTVHSQLSTGMMLYTHSPIVLLINRPVIVHFATNVDIVGHNYNNAKLNYVRRK